MRDDEDFEARGLPAFSNLPTIYAIGHPRSAGTVLSGPEKIGGTEEQTKARGTETTRFPLFLWLLSVSSVPNAFPDPAAHRVSGGNGTRKLR
jgi:hypothetical protein